MLVVGLLLAYYHTADDTAHDREHTKDFGLWHAEAVTHGLLIVRRLSTFTARTLSTGAVKANDGCKEILDALVTNYNFIVGAEYVNDSRGGCKSGAAVEKPTETTAPSIRSGPWSWYAAERNDGISVIDMKSLPMGDGKLYIAYTNELFRPTPSAYSDSAPKNYDIVWNTSNRITSPSDDILIPLTIDNAVVGFVKTATPQKTFSAFGIISPLLLLIAAIWGLFAAKQYVLGKFRGSVKALTALADGGHSTQNAPRPKILELAIVYDELLDVKIKLESSIRESLRLQEKATDDANFLRTLQSETGIGTWETDLKSGSITWSEQTYKIFGLDESESLDVQKLSKFIPEDDIGKFSKAQQAAERAEQKLDVVHQIIRTDGSTRVVHERGFTLLDSNGKATRMRGTVVDITDAYRTQANLQSLNSTLSASRDAIAIFEKRDKKQEIALLWTNTAMNQLLSELAPRESTEESFVDFLELFVKNDYELQPTLSSARNTFFFEQKGTVRWFVVDAIRGTRERSHYQTWSIMTRETTEEHKYKTQLQESEARYRILFDCHPLPLWLYDPKTLEIVDVNQQAVAAYGYSREQFLTKNLLDLRPEDDWADLRGAVSKAKGQVQERRRWRHIKADGTEIIVEVYGDEALVNGRMLRIACPIDRTREEESIQAITRLNESLEDEVKRRTQALIDSEIRYRTLTNLAPQIIWQTDTNGRVIYLSKAWETLVGGELSEWLTLGWLRAIHKDDVENTMNEFALATKERRTFKIQRRIRTQEGAYRDFLGVASPIKNDSGDIVSWIGVDTDITDYVKRGTQLGALNSELEAFVYSVSHDLRAPVQVIRGFADILLSGKHGTFDENTAKYLNRISASAKRMDGLISDLLRLSRLNRQELNIHALDLQPIIEDTVESVRERYPDQKIVVQTSIETNVQADKEMMTLVLENLIDNAAKFSQKEERTRIEIDVKRLQHEVVITIKDNGVGFPEEYAYKLFKPFQRLHTQREFPGNGIGLATIYRVIRRHDGEISAQSKLDEGATFTIRLPAQSSGIA